MNRPSADHGREVAAPMDSCWRFVGVGGDRSCPELSTFVHCRNCPVVAAAARRFFDRAAPAGYLEAWGEILAEPEASPDPDAGSVVVFRLGDEWLALPTTAVAEVTTPRKTHRVPHRSGDVLAGLVNIRGQLQLSIRMARLLGLPTPTDDVPGAASAARLLVVQHAGQPWVFGVDEVAGVHRVPRQAMRPPPATVGSAARHATAAVFSWRERTVGLLDEARLLDGLHRLVSA